MRITALVTDLIVNSSAQIAFVFYDFHKYNFAYKTIIVMLALISPGLTMIDHGHF